MWEKEPAIWKVLQQRHLVPDFLESSAYWLDNLDRIADTGYCATWDDLMHQKMITTGISENIIPFHGEKIRLVDVGGQVRSHKWFCFVFVTEWLCDTTLLEQLLKFFLSKRNERRKWQGAFLDKLQAVIYVVSLSEYDQVLVEDITVNRCQESLQALRNTLKWLHTAHMFLVFSKRDVFEQKIVVRDLSVALGKENIPSEILLENNPPVNQYKEASLKFLQQQFFNTCKEFAAKGNFLFDEKTHAFVVDCTDLTDVNNMYKQISDIVQ